VISFWRFGGREGCKESKAQSGKNRPCRRPRETAMRKKKEAKKKRSKTARKSRFRKLPSTTVKRRSSRVNMNARGKGSRGNLYLNPALGGGKSKKLNDMGKIRGKNVRNP